MRSALAMVQDIYDPREAAGDLIRQIKSGLEFGRNGCGILFMDCGEDWYGILPYLKAELPFPVVGCTAVGQLSSHGYHQLTASLLVMTGDDCVFSTAVADSSSANFATDLRDAYVRAQEGLGQEECKLVMAFSSQAPGVSDSARLHVLRDLADGIPVFGASASDCFLFTETRVFYDGEARAGTVVLLLMGGNVRPLFSVRNVIQKRFANSRITRSEGSVVHTIDDMTAHDFMQRTGADLTSTIATSNIPLCIEVPQGDGVRTVCAPAVSFNPDGSMNTLVEVPQGARVTLQPLNEQDVLVTTQGALEAVLQEIQAYSSPDYTYSTMLCMTCAGRYVVLAYDYEREAVIVKNVLPGGIAFLGFYSYGEFCPVSMENGKAQNEYHNMSIGLCAL